MAKFNKTLLTLIGEKITEGIAAAIRRGYSIDFDNYHLVAYDTGRVVCAYDVDSMGEFPSCRIRAFVTATAAGGLSIRAMVGAGEVVNVTISNIEGDVMNALDIDKLCEGVGDELERKDAKGELLFFIA